MTDMAEIFAKDPLQLTREDRTLLIEEYRKHRSQFNLGVKVTKAPKQATAPKGSEQIDIDELSL